MSLDQKKHSELSKIGSNNNGRWKRRKIKAIYLGLPKPLVPINNKPMLEHIISNFKFFNLQIFILCLIIEANLIKTYFNNSKEL